MSIEPSALFPPSQRDAVKPAASNSTNNIKTHLRLQMIIV
jgi:hypothetical protein